MVDVSSPPSPTRPPCSLHPSSRNAIASPFSRLDHILPQQHRYSLPCRNLVPVRRHNQETIRLCQRRNVSRSLPFQSLHFLRPAAPLHPRRQERRQTRLPLAHF